MSSHFLLATEKHSAEKQQLALVIVGHVDHGKSTLIGRLVHDMGCLPDGKEEAIRASCARRAVPFEWSFLMDALQAERSQGITIDMTQLWLRTPHRDYVIIDAPGHHEFLKNMLTGAAESDAAILLIDAVEGMREQTRRHATLLHLLGIRQVVVLINKMDAVVYDETRYRSLAEECKTYLHDIGITPAHIIPASAYHGVMVVERHADMPWYGGATLMEALASLHATNKDAAAPLRFPVQDVYKFDNRRIIAGTIESGTLRVGDEILISPTNYTARIASMEAWPVPTTPIMQAVAGQAVGITLEEQRFIERGHIISHIDHAPLLTNQFYTRLFWMHPEPLQEGETYDVRIATATYRAEAKKIVHILDTNSLQTVESTQVARHQLAEVLWQVRGGLAVLDEHAHLPAMGRCVVLGETRIVGGGIVHMQGLSNQRALRGKVKSPNVRTEEMHITRAQRAAANGHTGGILWFTGLSGSGKSTLAKELQQHLFAHGYQVYVLDGDNIRQGLNADLGFSPEERAENIRRVGEVAALFADAGMIVISAFISPYRADRHRARAAAAELFHTVYINAGVEACEARDVKGLYQKARLGEIADFTGVSAPYEIPDNPELVINTETHSVSECVEQLLAYVKKHFAIM
jgi:bifunctional enzyme CysN/CysC